MSTYSKVTKSLWIVIQSVFQLLSFLLSAWVIFMVYVMLGMIIPYQMKQQVENGQNGEKISIYVRSNGMHTDICVPLKNEYYNWWSFFDQGNFPDDNFEWVAIGWGDRDFYINTKTWDEFSLNTTLAALFMPTKSAMHVEMLYTEPQPSGFCEKIWIHSDNYIDLSGYIKGSFEINNGEPGIIDEVTYYGRDRFYNAKGDYHLFETCNAWTNQGLKMAGVQTSAWCLFPETIMSYLRQNRN